MSWKIDLWHLCGQFKGDPSFSRNWLSAYWELWKDLEEIADDDDGAEIEAPRSARA